MFRLLRTLPAEILQQHFEQFGSIEKVSVFPFLVHVSVAFISFYRIPLVLCRSAASIPGLVLRFLSPSPQMSSRGLFVVCSTQP